MILFIDNYDSFTYNLVQYVGSLGFELAVYRNDKIAVEEAEAISPAGIIISPGPGAPTNAGISNALIERFAGKIPILGVCLGNQCIGYVWGAKIVRARRLMHGKTSMIHHCGRGIFRGIPSPFEAVRYHSLIIERESVPPELEIVAETVEGEVMGVKHREFDVWGVQFHPESILTEFGMDIVKNFCGLLLRPENSRRLYND
ncbi:MAG: anthranilate synthase component II [bacterium]